MIINNYDNSKQINSKVAVIKVMIITYHNLFSAYLSCVR